MSRFLATLITLSLVIGLLPNTAHAVKEDKKGAEIAEDDEVETFEYLPQPKPGWFKKPTSVKAIKPKSAQDELSRFHSKLALTPIAKGSFGQVSSIQGMDSVVKTFKDDQQVSDLQEMVGKLGLFARHPGFLELFGVRYHIDAHNPNLAHNVSLVVERAGDTLQNYYIKNRSQNQTTEEELNQVSIDLLQAAQYLRQKHFLHLDIKPDNMMVMNDALGKRGVIIDTDTAVSLDHPPKNFKYARPGYTALYAPPELANRGALASLKQLANPQYLQAVQGEIDRLREDEYASKYGLSYATDDWALGISLFEVTVGKSIRDFYEDFEHEFLRTGAAKKRPLPEIADADFFRKKLDGQPDTRFLEYLYDSVSENSTHKIGVSERDRLKLAVFLSMINVDPKKRTSSHSAAKKIREIYGYPKTWGKGPRMPNLEHHYSEALLKFDDLRPYKKVKIGNQMFYVSRFLKLANTDIASVPSGAMKTTIKDIPASRVLNEADYKLAVMYSFDENTHSIVPVLLYKSRSAGEWRGTPGTKGGTTLSKGVGYHYTQETKLVPELMLALEEMEKLPMSRRTALPVPELLDIGMRSQYGLIDYFDKDNQQMIVAYVTKSQELQEIAECGTVKCFQTKKERIAEFIENIRYPKKFIPDFEKAPIDAYTLEHMLLGAIDVKVFEGKLDGRKVQWHMANDAANRFWIDRICFSPSEKDNLAEVNNYGAAKHLIDSGILTYKPLDYDSQLGNLNIPNALIPMFDATYRDVTPLLEKLKPIKDYKKALAAQVQPSKL